MIFTIQNEKGDKGFIQYIDENGVAHDEIMGGSYEIDLEWREQYCIITKEEYDVIKTLHNLLNETGYEQYLNLIDSMIDITINRNAIKLLK